MCMKNEKHGCYPTVIVRLCCGYHLVRCRYGIENGVEMEWKRVGNGVEVKRAGKEKMQKSNIFMRENLQMWEFFRNFVR